MSRRLSPAVILIAAIALPAFAEVPPRLPEERVSQRVDADDFLLFLPVERTAQEVEVLIVLAQEGVPPDSFRALRITAGAAELFRVRDGEPELIDRRTGQLPPPDQGFELAVRRRGPHIVVSADGDVLAHFLNDGFGVSRVGAWAERGATVGELLVQPLGDIIFDEDFFATESVPDRWETLRGQWKVGIYWDPLQERDNRPIGASWYEPGEGGCLAATGYDIWDSYRVAATARLGQGRGGLAFHVRGPDDYCAFEVGEGSARLIEVNGGEHEVLAETAVELRPDWWYRLRAEVSTGHARGFVNDRPLVEADLSPALMGRIGLCADGGAGSRFDDVSVRPFVATHIPRHATAAQAFKFDEGTWQIEDGVLHGHVRGMEVAGLRGRYSDSEVSATVSATNEAVVGIVAGHEPDEHKRALIFTIKVSQQPTWQLNHVDGDETTRLAAGPAPAASGTMALRFVRGRVTCSLDGQTLCETFVPQQLFGRAGAYLQGGRAIFRDFACRELTDEPQAIICHADGNNTAMPALEEKRQLRPIGNLWRTRGGSWHCRRTGDGPRILARGRPGDNRAIVRFHEVTPGEPRLIVDAGDAPGGAVTLGICAGDEPGYEVEFNETQSAFRFLRRGEVIYESGEGSEGTRGPGEIRRAGDWILIGTRLRGEMRTEYAWRDPEPLPDGCAEVSTTGTEVQLRSITLASDSARAYKFDRSEPDWQPASGEWTDHTGMACILWDYWMTGDGREEPALTWNRLPMPRNVALDVSAAEHTEGYADGDHRHFPYHDIKIVLSGSRGEPDSGYAFIAGADGGRRNVLLREGVEVASSDDPRCRIVMGGHCNSPRAVRLRAQRRGAELSLTFNGIEVLRWEDPQPLGAGHVALGCDGCRTIFRDCVIYPGVRGQGS